METSFLFFTIYTRKRKNPALKLDAADIWKSNEEKRSRYGTPTKYNMEKKSSKSEYLQETKVKWKNVDIRYKDKEKEESSMTTKKSQVHRQTGISSKNSDCRV